jgi:hypothetical protein
MDATLVYSRMHLIRNVKHLWFVIMRNFSIPLLSVPHSVTSKRSTKHRRPTAAFISVLFCESGINLAAEGGLDKNKLISVLNNVVKNVICNEIVPCLEERSGFRFLNNNRGYFVGIFSHLCQMCLAHLPYPTSSCPFRWKYLSVASTSLQQLVFRRRVFAHSESPYLGSTQFSSDSTPSSIP